MPGVRAMPPVLRWRLPDDLGEPRDERSEGKATHAMQVSVTDIACRRNASPARCGGLGDRCRASRRRQRERLGKKCADDISATCAKAVTFSGCAYPRSMKSRARGRWA